MKDLNKIVTSELVVRVNNVNFSQEYGEVGVDPNITVLGAITVFTTKYRIDKVIYISVNGVNLIENRHYTVEGNNTIHISKDGATALRQLPGLATTILVGYNYSNTGAAYDISTKVPPNLASFYLNKSSGMNGELIFNFIIEANHGRNIFWSILKDGNNTPLYSGTALTTENGFVPDPSGGYTQLRHAITEPEYRSRHGESIPFTFIVVYDLSEDGSKLDERILATATYLLTVPAEMTGSLVATPSAIATAGTQVIDIQPSLDLANVTLPFDWTLTEEKGGSFTPIASGNQSNLPFNTSVTHITQKGDNYTYRYALATSLEGVVGFTTVATDIVHVAVPAESEVARAGYLDTAILNYESPIGTWNTIGGLGTDEDRIKYNADVPVAIFTKTFGVEYLTNMDFISAPVNTFEGTVTQVHFVLEVPNSWGAFSFNEANGLIPIQSFNSIDLKNGRTAYLYRIGYSSASSPTDYFLKK